jgi:hypothetical protein
MVGGIRLTAFIIGTPNEEPGPVCGRLMPIVRSAAAAAFAEPMIAANSSVFQHIFAIVHPSRALFL